MTSPSDFVYPFTFAGGEINRGLTVREHAAIQIMTAAASNRANIKIGPSESPNDVRMRLARECVALADAVIAALNEKPVAAKPSAT